MMKNKFIIFLLIVSLFSCNDPFDVKETCGTVKSIRSSGDFIVSFKNPSNSKSTRELWFHSSQPDTLNLNQTLCLR